MIFFVKRGNGLVNLTKCIHRMKSLVAERKKFFKSQFPDMFLSPVFGRWWIHFPDRADVKTACWCEQRLQVVH